ncbi:hypothetical protein A3715_09925 [Oleiphilus sp. HI0009]|uniref:PA2779 family protein n=1 Tax=unclassified Oleiphilus TaxID=2631174 RepID=UPI0007C3013B|nr:MULTISPECIES: PA2779 family protein [unclassified Oleiphilus]KZX74935.1 hypothetical protein A3715_23280 [Oleiphilus sp. HI0009]KZX78577.1 hypothetical protein A3715_09925 [Oleiphilus sp. HI0009]KZY70611.1 hypothetical protein A3739_06375 [Oleiphilus sp. HI0067]MCH2158509.1 PA2779 family protein [Oleiphilaceae bacterium]
MSYFRSLSVRSVRALCLLLIVSFLPLSTATAGMVGTDQIIQLQTAEIERSQILDRLQADDAKQALAALGVDAAELEQRVANMTAEELSAFNAQIDELPAGGIGVFALIVFVLLLMIVLDLLGTVDFFPAIKTIQY